MISRREHLSWAQIPTGLLGPLMNEVQGFSQGSRLNKGPKRYPCPNPQNLYVTLYGKREFAGVKDLDMG